MIIDIPIEVIELEDESYHILIDVLFNKNLKGKLIIDTGASKTVFDSNFAESFVTDIQVINDNQSSGINAMISETKVGSIAELTLDSFTLHNYTSVLMDLSHVNEFYTTLANTKIAGLLGSDFLLKYEAVINYHQKKITFNF